MNMNEIEQAEKALHASLVGHALTVPVSYVAAALVCASKKDIRECLTGVQFEATGRYLYVSSADGCRLFSIRLVHEGPAFATILPRETLEAICKGKAAADDELVIIMSGDPRRAPVTLKRNAMQVVCEPIDAHFPDWRRVVPSRTTGIAAQFNPVYQFDMNKIMDALLCRRVSADVDIRAEFFYNGLGAARVHFPGFDAVGVVMPMRSDVPNGVCTFFEWGRDDAPSNEHPVARTDWAEYQYEFISDPGHGWLKVPVEALRDLNLMDKVSSFSYLEGSYAYLEEDLDMPMFMEASGAVSTRFHSRHEDVTPIREYANYTTSGAERAIK